jgi:hypothetical protein
MDIKLGRDDKFKISSHFEK